jgi:hypothetical protein
MAKKAAAKKVAKKSKKPKPKRKTKRAGGAAVSPEVAQILQRLHTSLNADAKTPDQRADASIVGLAQQHAAKGDVETVGSLLNKVSSWTTTKVSAFVGEHQDTLKHIAQHIIVKAVRGG